MDDVWVLLPSFVAHPHLSQTFISLDLLAYHIKVANKLTFLNVLNPARILPPIHVLYFLSGGAKILIRISFTAILCTSYKSRSPKPFVNVAPPESTMLP